MKSSVPNKFVKFFTYHWKVKLASLLFAVFLWYYVNSLDYIEKTINLPIQFENLPEGLIVLKSSDSSIDIKVRARLNLLKKVSPTKMVVPIVNLSNATIGTLEYKLVLQKTDTKMDVKLESKKKKIAVSIERLVMVTIPVKPKISGVPREGYIVDKITLEENKINIQGPSSIIEKIDFIETSPVDISSASNDIEKFVSIQTPDLVETVDKKSLNVTIKIKERRINKQVIVKIELQNLKENLKPVYPPEIMLILDLPGRYVSSYRGKVRVTADCVNAKKAGTHVLPIRVRISSGIKVINDTMRYVSVELIKK